MDSHDRLLRTFLAGELDRAGARRWDEHLLECERCWQAVREDRAGRQAAQSLRQPEPPRLADRVTFAVEVAADGDTAARRRSRLPARSRQPGRHGGWSHWRLAGAGMIAAVTVTLAMTLLPSGHQTGSLPAAVAVVARYAQAIPPWAGDQHSHSSGRAAPAEVGRPVTVTADGQRIMLRTWRLGGAEAVVAVSNHPFPMPARAQEVTSGGMAWSVQLGRLSLYCLNGRTSELVAAPVPAAELAALAARLPAA